MRPIRISARIVFTVEVRENASAFSAMAYVACVKEKVSEWVMRGIIFTGDHVSKILAGKKSQSRRLIKPQPEWIDNGCHGPTLLWKGRRYTQNIFNAMSPYHVGETLYCKETWGLIWNQVSDDHEEKRVIYKFGSNEQPEDNGGRGYWKPSIHMPECASRCRIKITGIKAERLQDISEEDDLAEGIALIGGRYTFNGGLHESRTARESFKWLWDSINKKYRWDSNPWVFCYSFEVVNHGL